MQSIIRFVTLAALAFAVAPAASAPGSSPAKSAKEITMPTSTAIVLMQGLSSLDGYERTVKDGARERVVIERYKFERGFVMAMARNLTALKAIQEAYEKEITAIRAEVADGGEIKDGPQLARLNDENRKLLALPQKIELVTIQEAELKLDVNPIPISVISALAPIME